MPRKIDLPTEAEDAVINRGIATDPDSPELTDAFFSGARPAREAMPGGTCPELVQPRRRGPARTAAKAQVTLRLDRDVVDGLRASGPGWQARANEALRRMLAK